MHITVSTTQVDLSASLHARVAQQLETIAQTYFDRVMEAHVSFSRARCFFTCDINLHACDGVILHGEGEAADASSALDDAAEHIAKRLRRYRRRANDLAPDLAHREHAQSAHQYVLREEGNEGSLATLTFATVMAEEQIEILPLSVREAVMRMDLADQPALMFRNPASGTLNVVYRRSDGQIGWIDPCSD
jgi:ribosomal subunit interface protein